MDNTLLWSDPAELRVVYQVAPCLSPVGNKGIECVALDAVGEIGDGGTYDLVTATNCESLENGKRPRKELKRSLGSSGNRTPRSRAVNRRYGTMAM